MAQRKTYTRSSATKSRTASSYGRKPSSASAGRYQPAGNQRHHSGGGGARIILVLILVAVIAVGAVVIIKNLPSTASANGDTIIEGISIDGINVAGMTKEAAFAAVQGPAQQRLDNISITFNYNNKTWTFTAEQLNATINIQSVVDQAYAVGRASESAKENKQVISETKANGLHLETKIKVEDRQVLVDALKDVKNEIDQPMVEAEIKFDPSGYDYVTDMSDLSVDMTKNMFTITPGSVGYAMDYDKALQELNDALSSGWNANINLSVTEQHPKYTVAELEECTTWIFHASSKISTDNKKNDNRNSNIAKAIGYFKGMVVEPGEMVDYNTVLGERRLDTGWLEAPTITQDKTLEDALGGGICQASTTIFNAVYMAGAKIIDRGPHSWPAYYNDFGYGMDAMVNWGTDDFTFQNTSEYPIFINTYFWYDSYGRPNYIDVDIFTMPQKAEDGTVLHIRPDITVEKEDAPPPTYKEAAEGEFADKTWKTDTTLNKQIYVYRNSRQLVRVSVDKVWYKDCVQSEPGVWTGGVEVKREHSHNDIYQSVAAIIYTRPIPAATASPSPAPS